MFGLGTRLFGNRAWGPTLSKHTIANLIAIAHERGVRWIDTAPIYGFGNAELFLGDTLGDHKHSMKIITKGGLVRTRTGRIVVHNQPDQLLSDLEGSLRRLNRAYVDCFLAHWPDNHTSDDTVLETLNRIKQSGKAKTVGLSNWPTQGLEKILDHIDHLQYPSNLLSPDANTLFTASQNSKTVTSGYSPLAMGLLKNQIVTRPKFGKRDERSHSPWFKEPQFSTIQKGIAHFLVENPGIKIQHLALSYARTQCDLLLLGVRSEEQLHQLLAYPPLDDALCQQLAKQIQSFLSNTC